MRNRAELRDEIFAAARAEFARYGLAGARIDRVAKEARASKERLYAHFGDKENLFREVVAADTAQFLGAVVPRPEALPEFVGDIFDLARTHPEHIRMITWARLEQLELIPPDPDKLPAIGSAVIAAAQAAAMSIPVGIPTSFGHAFRHRHGLGHLAGPRRRHRRRGHRRSTPGGRCRSRYPADHRAQLRLPAGGRAPGEFLDRQMGIGLPVRRLRRRLSDPRALPWPN